MEGLRWMRRGLTLRIVWGVVLKGAAKNDRKHIDL